MRGGGVLTLTGRLGDVMGARARAGRRRREGRPSAGVAMAAALVSATDAATGIRGGARCRHRPAGLGGGSAAEVRKNPLHSSRPTVMLPPDAA